MSRYSDVVNQVVPILLLLYLGYAGRRKGVFGEASITALKWIAVNLALPAVLFISFMNVRFDTSFIVVFVLLFLLCVALFLAGTLYARFARVCYGYFPYLVTGFEYGMLGVSLFGAAYGVDRIGAIAVIDLGHEIFIWFLFLPLLLAKRDGYGNARGVFRAFLLNPVIIAILAGITVNLLGAVSLMNSLPLIGGVIGTLVFLSGLIVPLILLIVGYGIRIEKEGLVSALPVVVFRLGLLIPLALILNRFLIREFLLLSPVYEAALFTILVLPPPFIVPLYADRNMGEDETRYINNVLAVHTLASLAAFLCYFIATGSL